MIENKTMELLQMYMDDEIREEIHYKYAPCSNEFFLKKYCEEDTEFQRFVLDDFGIDVNDLVA